MLHPETRWRRLEVFSLFNPFTAWEPLAGFPLQRSLSDDPRGQRAIDDSARRDDRRGADMDATENHASAGHPYSLSNMNWLGNQCHFFAVPVTSSGQHGLLRDDHVVLDMDVVLVVEPHSFAYPRAITDVKFPWEFDSRARPKDDTVANVGSESTQYSDSKAGTDLPRIRDEQEFTDTPEVDDPARSVPAGPLPRSL